MPAQCGSRKRSWIGSRTCIALAVATAKSGLGIGADPCPTVADHAVDRCLQFGVADIVARGAQCGLRRRDPRLGRRQLLLRALGLTSGVASGALLSGCEKLSRTEWFPKILESAESVTRSAQRLLLPRKAMAEEFSESDRSPFFRSNGTAMPRNPQYIAVAAGWNGVFGKLIASRNKIPKMARPISRKNTMEMTRCSLFLFL